MGFKVPLDDGSDSEAISLGLRLHHVSNANLLKDNRGVNSVFLMVGYQF